MANIAAPGLPEQARRGLLLGVAAVVLAGGGVARAVDAGLERLSPYPVLRSGDGGGPARLAGVVVPAAEGEGRLGGAAAAMIRDWLAAGPFGTEAAPKGPDRHGRRSLVLARGGETLQGRLVAAGLAIAAAEGGVPAGLLRALLAVEAGARAEGLGWWAEGAHGPFAADAVPLAAVGRYVLVEGPVARVGKASQFWFANYGRDLRRDFTVRVPLAAAGDLAAAGVGPEGLAGRDVRVRGWLFEDNGPMIEVTHPLALEPLS